LSYTQEERNKKPLFGLKEMKMIVFLKACNFKGLERFLLDQCHFKVCSTRPERW